MENNTIANNNTVLSTILTVVTATLKGQQNVQLEQNDLKVKALDIINNQKTNTKSLDNIVATTELTTKQVENLKEMLTIFIESITNADDMTVEELYTKINTQLSHSTRELQNIVTQSKPINYTEHITKLVESVVILQKNVSAVVEQQKEINSRIDDMINRLDDNKQLLSTNSSRINSLDLRIASLIENGLTPVTDASLTQLINDLNINI